MDGELDSPSDDVRAAVAQLQNPDVAKEPVEPELPLEAEPEEKPDRPRDELGRFAKETEKAPEPDKSSKTEPTAKAPAAAVQPAAGAPPARLSKEAKALWGSVSPAIQAEWAKMETDTAKGVEKLRAEHQTALSNFQGIEAELGPRRENLRQLGFQTDQQALQHLFSFSDAYEKDPTGLVLHLASQPNVDRNRVLTMLANGAQPQQQQAQPQIQQQRPVDIKAAIREEIGLANASSEIEAFAADPQYPHFQTVRPLMSHFLQSGAASTLEDAYDQAVWANPTLRNERMEAVAAEKAKTDEAARAKQLEAKRRATNASLSGAPHGASPTSKPNGRTPANAHDDTVEDVRAAIAQLS